MPKQVNPTKKKQARIEPGSIEYWELVRARAYFNWEKRCRCCLPGDECSDWVNAEEDVNAMLAAQPPPAKTYNRRKK